MERRRGARDPRAIERLDERGGGFRRRAKRDNRPHTGRSAALIQREEHREPPHSRSRGHHRAWRRDPARRGLDRGHGEGVAAGRAREARAALRRDPRPQRQPDERRGDRGREEPEGDRAGRGGRRQRGPRRRHPPRRPRHELARRQHRLDRRAGRRPDARAGAQPRPRRPGDEGREVGPEVLRRGGALREAPRGDRLRPDRPRGGRAVPGLRDGGPGLRPVRLARGGRAGPREAAEPRGGAADLRLPDPPHDPHEGDEAPAGQGRLRPGEGGGPHRERRPRRADRRRRPPRRARQRPRGRGRPRRPRPGAAEGLAPREAPEGPRPAAPRGLDEGGAGAGGHRHRPAGARLPEGRCHPVGRELLLPGRRPLRPGPAGHGPRGAARALPRPGLPRLAGADRARRLRRPARAGPRSPSSRRRSSASCGPTWPRA